MIPIDENNIGLLRKKQLYIAETVRDICENNNLRCFIVGGSLLGAVQDKTFIAGDKDIDLGLLRNDYEKFIRIAKKELPEDLEILECRSNSEYNWLFSKVYLKGTRFALKNEMHKSYMGIYIDICPYDYVPEKLLGRLLKINYTRFLKWLLLGKSKEPISSGIMYQIIRLMSRLVPRDILISAMTKDTKKTKIVQNIVGGTKNDWFFCKELDNGEYVKFAGKDFFAPEFNRYLDENYNRWGECLVVRNELKDYMVDFGECSNE